MARLSLLLCCRKEHQGNIGLLQERRRSMNATLKRTLKALLYAGAALMVVVAGSANWPHT
jgi:hypothetical protein